MSVKISYLPNSDSEKVIWLNNFSIKIKTYATQVGITAGEVTSIKNDAAFFFVHRKFNRAF